MFKICKFRRRETPWEVVDNKSVEPVPMYYCEDDIDIVSISETDIRGTYLFDTNHLRKISAQDAVVFARQQLLLEAAKKGYNFLLLESWRLTILRRGKEHRMEVQYSGRPSRTLDKPPKRQAPPFMAVLQT